MKGLCSENKNWNTSFYNLPATACQNRKIIHPLKPNTLLFLVNTAKLILNLFSFSTSLS